MKFAIVVLGLFLTVSAVPLELNAAQEELTKGAFDFLSGLFTDVFLPPITTAVQDTSGLLAQITAGIAEGGIGAIIGLLGKRDVNGKGVFDDLVTTITDGTYNLANQLTQQLGLTLTQLLLQISQGKRSAEEFKGAWSDFFNAIKDGAYNLADQLAQQLGLTLTQALLQISQGKRGAFDFLTVLGSNLAEQFGNIVNQVIAPALHLSVQQAAALLAQLTATVAVDGLPGAINILSGLLGGGVGY